MGGCDPLTELGGLAKRPPRRHISGMRRWPFLFALLLPLAAGCERATDPSVVEEERIRMPRGAPNTLSVLFEEALRTAQRREGAASIRSAIEIWQARQAEVQAAHAAGEPSAVQAKLQSLRNAEIRFVLSVFGNTVVSRVLSETNVALANARFRLLEAAQQGAQTTAAEASAEEVSQLLSRATAWASRDPARALDLGTEAARLLDGIDDAIIDFRRVRGVETLFPEIASSLPAEQLRTHVRLQSDAHAALRAGARHAASEKLAAVRAEEIRLVLKATRNAASGELLQQLESSIGELTLSLQAFKATGSDALRRERMLVTARDLYQQAQTAQARGDFAGALDLGSHAAGLLNSLRHLLVK